MQPSSRRGGSVRWPARPRRQRGDLRSDAPLIPGCRGTRTRRSRSTTCWRPRFSGVASSAGVLVANSTQRRPAASPHRPARASFVAIVPSPYYPWNNHRGSLWHRAHQGIPGSPQEEYALLGTVQCRPEQNTPDHLAEATPAGIVPTRSDSPETTPGREVPLHTQCVQSHLYSLCLP